MRWAGSSPRTSARRIVSPMDAKTFGGFVDRNDEPALSESFCGHDASKLRLLGRAKRHRLAGDATQTLVRLG